MEQVCSGASGEERLCVAHKQVNFCGFSLHLQLLKRPGRAPQNFAQHFCSQEKNAPIWFDIKMSPRSHASHEIPLYVLQII